MLRENAITNGIKDFGSILRGLMFIAIKLGNYDTCYFLYLKLFGPSMFY